MNHVAIHSHDVDGIRPVARRVTKNVKPLNDEERLLAEVFLLLMEIDDTNRVDEETASMVESLPWEQLRLLRDRLGGRSETLAVASNWRFLGG